MKNVAFIPLRGGSQSIPLKNIKLLAGRPLAYYVLDAADECPYIDTIIVSTDSDLIRKTILQHPSKKIQVIHRSPEVSTAEASTASTLLEFATNYTCETIVLIQATSPLLLATHLCQGFEIYQQGQDSVLSVVRRHNFIWKEDGTPLNYDPKKRPRRQDWDGMLFENGAFYITSYTGFLESQCLLNGKIGLSEMPVETFVEIDDPIDWLYVESLIPSHKKSQYFPDIKMLLCECDGILTDAGMYYSKDGELLKKFNTRDGYAFEMLNNIGIITGIISGGNTEIVLARGKKINAKEIHIGIKNKLLCLQELAKKYHCTLEQIAFIGDDLNDIEVLNAVGFAAVPQDAVPQAKAVADYISGLSGGHGAVRDIVDYILSKKS
ncbi:MAG: cytidylyltransferase domain-containing protein [Spirochaetia bacterium]